MAFNLSLFIYNKFRIFALRLISADEEKIHICRNAEAAAAAEETGKLIAEVCERIIQKLYPFPAARFRYKSITVHMEF